MFGSDWETRSHAASVGALYLHVPFCVRKCSYCDFASWATRADDPLVGRYADALKRQVRQAADLGLLEGCETAYVGGGTPTLLGENIGDVVRALREEAPGIVELTVEANPESLLPSVLRAVVDAGATRLSVGVQSLHDEELRQLGRVHDATTALERVSEAVRAGLDVSVDLMCAIPAQTPQSWRETLLGAIALGVGHVSVYPLAIEEGTPLALRVGDDDPAWNEPDVQADRMLCAEELLEGAGLSRYEVASYALPGHQCRHNTAYWTGVPYLGLGTGAAGMLTREGYDLLRGVCTTLPAVPDGASRVRLVATTPRHELGDLRDARFDVEFLTQREALAEDLMLGARLSRGLDPALVSRARNVIGARVDDTLAGCLDDGLLRERDGRLAPTHRGWLLGNELYGRLWSLAEGT